MSRPPVTHDKPHYQLKVFMSIADFNRRADKFKARGLQGPIDYALQNYYLGTEHIFSIDHDGESNTEESRTLKQNQTT